MEMQLVANKSGLFCALIDDADFELLRVSRWTVDSYGYALGTTGPAKHITMQIFLMQPPQGMIVHHENENKLDNRRSNLVVLSHHDHAMLHRPKGEQHKDVTLSLEHYNEIRAIGRSIPQRSIARAYGTSQTIVCAIVNGKYWRDSQ